MLRGPRRGTASSSPGSARRVAVSSRSRPMSATTTRPAQNRPGATARPTFAAWNVTVRSASTTAPAISPVEASTPDGISTATTGARCRVDALDDGDCLRSWGTAEPRSEQRVDHDVVPVEPLVGLVRDMPGLAKDASSDSSVPAVRTSSTHAREAARGRIGEHRLARDRCACALHELRDRGGISGVPLLGRSHLGGAVERLVALSHRSAGSRRRSRLRSRANASSRGRSAPPALAPRRLRFAPKVERLASAARRSRSPST